MSISAAKKHLSLHIMSTKIAERIKKETEGAELSGATLHFTPENPLRQILVRRIVELRIQEVENSLRGKG